MNHKVQSRVRHHSIIQRVDDCVERFYDERLNDTAFFRGILHATYPRISGLDKPEILVKNIRYLSAMMACSRHEGAIHVYALHFRKPSREVSILSKINYAEDLREISMDKIGWSISWRDRASALQGECPFEGLKFHSCIAMFPVKGEGTALHLEAAIMGSMPREDAHPAREWYYSSLGVWKILLRWHLACFGIWPSEDRR